MNINSLYVAEYSHSQHKFNCDYLKVSIGKNLKSVNNDEPNDWIIIGIFKTWEETQEFIEKTKKQLHS